MKVAILGAGISGLAAAYRLSREHEVTVFEARDRVGGNIRTEEVESCRVEWGPNGWLDNEPQTLGLVKDLGLEPRLVKAREAAARRYVWRAGKLRLLPTKPRSFLASSCLPLAARLRVLLEPFAPRPPNGDESVYDFAARRIGKGAADILVDAFVTGVYAGDPHRLSVRSAFPRLKALESEHGSLWKGARGRGFAPKGTLTSMDHGLQVLVDELSRRVDVRLRTPWDELKPREFDRVICTVPAPVAAEMAEGLLARLLRAIPTAPVAVVAFVFDEPLDVPDAFGFLAPRGQGLRILGALYDSSIFPGRAPAGLRLVRVMVGGRRDPEALDLQNGALVEAAARDLRQAWRTWREPRAVRVIRHPTGIAQYERGHGEVVARLVKACPPWLRLAGSSYGGVSINACVKEAAELVLTDGRPAGQ
jgi:oxygen-dependent protoporphyrinogen oxidase